MGVKSPHAVSPRFPVQRSSEQGESAPKARQRCVADGKQVNIPAPSYDASGVTDRGGLSGGWKSLFLIWRRCSGKSGHGIQGIETSELVHEAIGSGSRKSLSASVIRDRTANRHRWAR